jgi:hypothetical protein
LFVSQEFLRGAEGLDAWSGQLGLAVRTTQGDRTTLATASNLRPHRFRSRTARISRSGNAAHTADNNPRRNARVYAFTFCQGGFRQARMTFEQFLMIAAAIKPADLPATREEG